LPKRKANRRGGARRAADIADYGKIPAINPIAYFQESISFGY
jgi:hypothetical protein